MSRQQCLVRYSGRVQGVGFRATTRSLASSFQVGGYVRNLPDGSVELVAEGERTEVEGLLAEIRRSLGRFIRDEQADQLPPSGAYQEFEIRY